MSELHERGGMSRREARVYRTWRHTHHGKWRYPDQWRAWRAVFRFWRVNRRVDWDLHPYVCRWGPDWRKGASYPPHIHIGHGRRFYNLPRRIRHWRNRLVVWPYYRVRRAYRIATGQAQAPPDHRRGCYVCRYLGAVPYGPPYWLLRWHLRRMR